MTGYPFSLVFKSQKPSADINNALYAIKRSDDGLQIDFEYSDGKVFSRKTFNFTKDSSSPQVWRASTGGKGPQPYSVNVTYFSGEGQVIKAPTQSAAGQAFVVPPLAPFRRHALRDRAGDLDLVGRAPD